MKGFPAATLLLLLVGCAADNTPQAECRSAAYADPQVKALTIQLSEGLADAVTVNQDRNRAINRATLQCLRDKGLAAPGGVEAVQPRE